MAMNSTFARSNNQFGNSFGATTGGRKNVQQPAQNNMSSTFGKSFGDGNKYQSTIQMNFRGQDRKTSNLLGKNPNQEPEADYIENLQQQIHFMDLERKILKEKVVEDEKNSGIGSLYDDEKTSHQHIQQLKIKYREMKRKFSRNMDQLNDENLEIIGKQFELDAQLEIINKQINDLNDKIKEYSAAQHKKQYDLKNEYNAVNNKRQEFETEVTQQKKDLDKEGKNHYDNKMFLYKDEQFGEVNDKRHQDEVDLTKKIHEEHAKNQGELDKEKQALYQKFNSNAELQKSITEAKDKSAEIERVTVEIQALELKADGLKSLADHLDQNKDDLVVEVKEAKTKNEELKVQTKSKEEILNKKLYATMQRDKNPDMKELIASEELVKQNNEELEKKLAEEQAKFDKFLLEEIEYLERIRLATEDHKEYQEHNVASDKDIDELKKLIAIREKEVNELDEQVKEEARISEREEELNRRHIQEHATLKERLKYIEDRIDYTGSVKGLDPNHFKTLTQSNLSVNESVKGFIDKLQVIKDEVIKMEALKQQY